MLAVLFVFTPSVYAEKEKFAQQSVSVVNLQGKVAHYLINPFGEVDGLFLDNGTLVKMPPYMSGDVVKLIIPGEIVVLEGAWEGESSVEAHSITNKASGQTLLRRKPKWNGRVMPKELRVAELNELSTNGRIERIIIDKRGEPKIVILENGTNIRLPKGIAYDAYSLINTGAPFAAKGSGTETRHGISLEASAIGTSLTSLQPLFGASEPEQDATLWTDKLIIFQLLARKFHEIYTSSL